MSDVPERIWAFKPDIFDNCSVWQDAASPAGDAIEYVRADRIEELEAKLAKAVKSLEAWLELSGHCSIEEGACCCGEDMKNHSNPMDCGHTPLDHGTYIAEHLEKTTRATLAELTGGQTNDQV